MGVYIPWHHPLPHRLASHQRLLPPLHTQTPPTPFFQPHKARSGRHQVIAPRLGILEKLIGHYAADKVFPTVFSPAPAVAVPEETGRVGGVALATVRLEGPVQDCLSALTVSSFRLKLEPA